MAENNGRKLFYTIGEMSKLAQVEPYILRYWESEFDLLHPEKRKNGQRMFKEKDLEIIFGIKELLYNQGYTIAGAKKKLIENRKNSESQEELFQSDPEHYKAFLLKLKKELEELNDLLDAK